MLGLLLPTKYKIKNSAVHVEQITQPGFPSEIKWEELAPPWREVYQTQYSFVSMFVYIFEMCLFRQQQEALNCLAGTALLSHTVVDSIHEKYRTIWDYDQILLQSMATSHGVVSPTLLSAFFLSTCQGFIFSFNWQTATSIGALLAVESSHCSYISTEKTYCCTLTCSLNA